MIFWLSTIAKSNISNISVFVISFYLIPQFKYKKFYYQIFLDVFFILYFQDFLKHNILKTNDAPQTLTFVRGKVLLASGGRPVRVAALASIHLYRRSRFPPVILLQRFRLFRCFLFFDTLFGIFEMPNLILAQRLFLFFSVNL